MLKLTKKIIAIFIVSLMMVTLIPLKYVNATTETLTSNDGVLSFEGEEKVVKGKSEYTQYLTVHNTSMNEEMAGFIINVKTMMTDNGSAVDNNKDISVEIQTEGWNVTDSQIMPDTENKYKQYRYIVEVEDEYLSTNNATQDVKIKVVIPLIEYENLAKQTNVMWNNWVESRTDNFGRVYTSVVEDSQISIAKTFSVSDNITVKEDYQNYIIIDNDNFNIYAKLDGHTDTITNTYWDDFLSKIDGLDSVFSYKIQDFTEENTRWDSTEDDENSASTAKLIVEYAYGTDTTYNIYLLGDIKLDTNYQIDINDVYYLRQAIVGKVTETTEDFCLETTDVNNSNVTDEGRGLGDIGDVILLRKRIINCKWD